MRISILSESEPMYASIDVSERRVPEVQVDVRVTSVDERCFNNALHVLSVLMDHYRPEGSGGASWESLDINVLAKAEIPTPEVDE